MDTQRFRALLDDELARLDRGAAERRRELTADDPELSHADQHVADAASEVTEMSMQVALSGVLEERAAEVRAALARLDAGDYGRCEVCGMAIEDARLEANATARTCIEHREQDAALPRAEDPAAT